MRKIAYALETLKDSALAVLSGDSIIAGRPLSEHRMEICRSCPHFDKIKCKVCGCNMELKSKISTAKCPKNYWATKLLEKLMYDDLGSYDEEKCCSK